jgi:HPt (histidine-containing phosphotransfer) domain-containing protein
MTLQELYESIGGDYEQALRVLRVEKLIDKHIRKLTGNGVVDNLLAAGETMDPTQLFETAHATKGVCANLGLTRIAGLASEIAEEFRPGTPRTMSDDEVKDRLRAIDDLYETTKEGIARYVAE